MRTRTSTMGAIIVLVATAGITLTEVTRGQSAEVHRGRLLYENHCIKCHDDGVHIRDSSKVRNAGDLRAMIVRWQSTLGLDWTQDEIDEVQRYLRYTYYDAKWRQ